ncbi:hypothetical protein B0A55_05749 [Friedmanniomyces simplex]|uniref:Uncharacterized protein n=1 Tax=Friedmanniomyces simplex TaxID=329884 RepID=A0A4U0X7Y4_9PEZI|nr:hypothetical protein B0A55_05749 [Friedmanniomyces simplex]
MPPKRKSTNVEEDGSDNDLAASVPAPKKRRTQTQLERHTLASLLALPHQDLAEYALSLQEHASQPDSSGAEAWSDEKITERAAKTRDVCRAEIKKQMKWQPSCKAGTTKWSYTGLAPHEDVFYKLFQFEKPKKPWKVRYNTLRITGEEVRVNWDQEEKTFKLSGTYGL